MRSRKGTHSPPGQQADELILGLACVGLAITGRLRHARCGGARAGGNDGGQGRAQDQPISGQMAAWINRSVREVIDWTSAFERLRVPASEPAAAVRAAREAVKVEKARDLVRLVGDVGRVQTRAGTQAALDG